AFIWKSRGMLSKLAFGMALVFAGFAQSNLPDGPGKATTIKVCGKCHGMDVTTSRRETAEGWNAIVLQMIKRGAKGTYEQSGEVVDYRAEHFPKSAATAKILINTASAKDLGAGLGISDTDASAIVQYREQKGPFKTFDELLKVP